MTKELDCMRRIIAILLLCLVMTLSLVGCGKDKNNIDNSNIDPKNATHYVVDTDSLALESSTETANGDIIDIYTDSQYRYFVFRETNELNVLSLSDEMMASLEHKYDDNPDANELIVIKNEVFGSDVYAPLPKPATPTTR